MRNCYEVIGSFTYVNIRGAEPESVQVTESANVLAGDAEEAIAVYKDAVYELAAEHQHLYSNGEFRMAADLAVSSATIESVALLAVGVYE